MRKTADLSLGVFLKFRAEKLFETKTPGSFFFQWPLGIVMRVL